MKKERSSQNFKQYHAAGHSEFSTGVSAQPPILQFQSVAQLTRNEGTSELLRSLRTAFKYIGKFCKMYERIGRTSGLNLNLFRPLAGLVGAANNPSSIALMISEIVDSAEEFTSGQISTLTYIVRVYRNIADALVRIHPYAAHVLKRDIDRIANMKSETLRIYERLDPAEQARLRWAYEIAIGL